MCFETPDSTRVAGNAGAQLSRTFRDQRDARLVVRRARRLARIDQPGIAGRDLVALEREQHSAPGRASKLQRLLMDDRQLFQDMLETPMSDLRATRCGDSS